MCPVCIATAALIAGSAASTGGLTALVVKKFRPKKMVSSNSMQSKEKEKEDGH
jgi:hypothetical protein